MGYLRFFAVIEDLEDTSALHAIPDTIPWRTYRLRPSNLILIDWLKYEKTGPAAAPETPEFSRRPSGTSFEDHFGSVAPGLNDLYAELKVQRRAGTMPKVAVHTTLLLHDLTSRPVLGIASDDQDWDFVCEARDNSLVMVRFASGDDEISVGRDGQVHKTSNSGEHRMLHRIASQESKAWSDNLEALFGFDGDVAPLDLIEVDRSSTSVISVNRDKPTKRPFWRFW